MNPRKVKAIQRNREWVTEYKKGLKCKFCGESRPLCLDFHHKDPKTKKKKVSALVNTSYSLAVIQAEIDKCEVVCANCHRILHYNINKNREVSK